MISAIGPRAHPDGDAASPLAKIASFFLIAYACSVLLVVFVSALAPEIEYDPLAMHLNAARTYAEVHRLTAITDIPQTFFPRNITMLYTLGMLLHGETTAKLLNFLLGLLTIWVTYSFARLWFFSAAILLASPLFVWEMKTAHLDLGFTLYVGLALYATVQWLENSDASWFRLAILFTAFSLGTKYQALFSLSARRAQKAEHGHAGNGAILCAVSSGNGALGSRQPRSNRQSDLSLPQRSISQPLLEPASDGDGHGADAGSR
jgi:hypothetical protein